MLTSGQCRVVAYTLEDDVLCYDCGQSYCEDVLSEAGYDRDKRHDEMVKAAGGSIDLWERDRIQRKLDDEEAKLIKKSGIQPLIQYCADEMAGDDGLYCDQCSKEIVEPAEDDDESEDDE